MWLESFQPRGDFLVGPDLGDGLAGADDGGLFAIDEDLNGEGARIVV